MLTTILLNYKIIPIASALSLSYPKLRLTVRVADVPEPCQTWLSIAGVAWLFSQAKLYGNFCYMMF